MIIYRTLILVVHSKFTGSVEYLALSWLQVVSAHKGAKYVRFRPLLHMMMDSDNRGKVFCWKDVVARLKPLSVMQ